MTKWMIKRNKARPGSVERICELFNVTPLAATVMLNRGLGSVAEVEYYKNASIDNLHTLADIDEVKKAFSIITSAIKNSVPIIIYGDYDVDGVTSTVILCKGLRALGAKVDYFIPDRHTDGYGLNASAIKTIADKGCGLLITCDNGIAAKNEIDYAKGLGMQTVILDHHEPAFKTDSKGEKRYIIPQADAVVDLKLEGINYPFRNLCAGGLCYKFVRELFTYLNRDFYLNDELAVFAALATVCDVVELKDENRVIVRYGLEIINSTVPNKGLGKLIEVNNLIDKRLTEYTFGFIIGPCINAGGRLEAAALSAELFMSEDEDRTAELAERLFELNAIRKEMTSKSFEHLVEQADKSDDRVLVLYDSSVDESIAGIVAGRLKERYNKPVIVLTDGDKGAKGSGRSIESYDMFEELSRYRELFTKFGGHKMAAGMSLPKENIPMLRSALNDSCSLTKDDMEKCLYADKIIDLTEADITAANDMEMFKPYGTGNPEPIVAVCSLKISNLFFAGNEKNIALFSLSTGTGRMTSAVWFEGEKLAKLINDYYHSEVIDKNRNVGRDLKDLRFDIMANLRVDEYKGNRRAKLYIKDMRISTAQ